MTHICVGNQTIIGSDNGLSPGRYQAIIWTNAVISLNPPLGTNSSEILIEIHIFHVKNAFVNGVCEIATILSRPQCVPTPQIYLIGFQLIHQLTYSPTIDIWRGLTFCCIWFYRKFIWHPYRLDLHRFSSFRLVWQARPTGQWNAQRLRLICVSCIILTCIFSFPVVRYESSCFKFCPLQWRLNEREGFSNHQPHDCLLNRLFRRRSKKHLSSMWGEFTGDWWIPRTNGQ